MGTLHEFSGRVVVWLFLVVLAATLGIWQIKPSIFTSIYSSLVDLMDIVR